MSLTSRNAQLPEEIEKTVVTEKVKERYDPRQHDMSLVDLILDQALERFCDIPAIYQAPIYHANKDYPNSYLVKDEWIYFWGMIILQNNIYFKDQIKTDCLFYQALMNDLEYYKIPVEDDLEEAFFQAFRYEHPRKEDTISRHHQNLKLIFSYYHRLNQAIKEELNTVPDIKKQIMSKTLAYSTFRRSKVNKEPLNFTDPFTNRDLGIVF